MRRRTNTLLVGAAMLLTLAAAASRTASSTTAATAATAPGGTQGRSCNESPVEYRDICEWFSGKVRADARNVRILNGDPGSGEWKITAVQSHAVYLGKDEPREAALLVLYRDIRMLENDRYNKTTIHLRRDQD